MSLVQQRLGSGEMNSEMFQEHVLYFGKERYFSRKIPIFVGTSKKFLRPRLHGIRSTF